MNFAEHNFGKYLMAFFAKQTNPFKRLKNKHNPLDKKYQDVVNIAVFSYQAHSYLNLIEAEFGTQTHHLAQVQVRNVMGSNQYNYDYFTEITKLIDFAVEMGQIEVTEQNKTTQVPLEINIALSILLGLPGSPHYAPRQKSRETEIYRMAEDVDQKFAQYLEEGKARMKEWFSRIPESFMKTATRN